MGFVIRRGKLPTDNFTIVPNDYSRDVRLSWEARGLLIWLMGHSDSFKVTEEKIVSAGNRKRDGVRKMVGELEAHGYLRRDKVFTPGVGTTVDYVLTDPDDVDSVASDDVDSVVRDDQAKQEDRAGQPYDGESVAPSYREDQEKNKKTSSSSRATRSATATRVPDDFMPDEKMRAWYAAEKLEQIIDGRIEHQKFMNYWQALPGVKGKKLDWPATWRNWMLEAASRASRNGYTRPVSAPPGNSVMPHTGGMPGTYRPSTTDQKIAQTLELGRRLQAQMEETK